MINNVIAREEIFTDFKISGIQILSDSLHII